MTNSVCRTGAFLFGALLCLTAGARNPIVTPGRYFADPSARVGPDGQLYLYGSKDESADYYCSHRYDVISTDDMRHWRTAEDVFASEGEHDEVSYSDALLYAPDCLYENGICYLYYCLAGPGDVIGVAASLSPAGPFCGGTPVAGCRQIDPAVFRDDDGTCYLFWGQFAAKGAVLNPDRRSVDPGTLRDSLLTERNHFFHEGIQVFKRNGIYYAVFTDISRRGMATCIGYATASEPLGPYTYRGVIVDNFGCDPCTWNNHGSVACMNGQWYVFYHRSTHGSVTMRKACVEPIRFRDDGTICEAEMTTQGASGPLDPFVRTEAEWACALTGSARISAFAAGEERLTRIGRFDSAGYKYFDFSRAPESVTVCAVPRQGGRMTIYADNLCAPLLAEITVPPGDGLVPQLITVPVRVPLTGVHTLYFRFQGEDRCELFDVDWFCFE